MKTKIMNHHGRLVSIFVPEPAAEAWSAAQDVQVALETALMEQQLLLAALNQKVEALRAVEQKGENRNWCIVGEVERINEALRNLVA